jgi:cyanophycinase-like exopeptidase
VDEKFLDIKEQANNAVEHLTDKLRKSGVFMDGGDQYQEMVRLI